MCSNLEKKKSDKILSCKSIFSINLKMILSKKYKKVIKGLRFFYFISRNIQGFFRKLDNYYCLNPLRYV